MGSIRAGFVVPQFSNLWSPWAWFSCLLPVAACDELLVPLFVSTSGWLTAEVVS